MKSLIISILFLFTSLCIAQENLELLISQDAISQKLKEAARIIEEEYKDKELTIVAVMKGSICLAADLIRNLHMPFTLECVRASSYGLKGKARGELKLRGLGHLDFSSKDVLLIDDIFDSGNTMVSILKYLQGKNPKSLKTLTLLLKNVERETTYRPDYVLCEIENRFVVGYGLDYKEHYRGLPGIYAFVNDSAP
ncbi:MAG: hypoxanthine phosphoribosyltransferase [Chlamydiae bacterium]|nr:hypoxanthine phosphoribosyltransferase [Chlamydiota bacterium]